MKLKDQKSTVRSQRETQKTGKQKDRNKKDRKQRNKKQKGKSPFSFERTGASWQVRACVEIIEK
ncbi:hypothetical protein BCT31_20220 [Vibrio lentus]|nr:hypothetical protein BCU96_23500 [Vibrio lentus]PMH11820.1 hypothetical protein BCU76_23590 [Vibrio lentus]PMJ08659.1 hypothetical protein BCU30_24660 [Vibrio lentus]PMK91914.1 hypothetical protein BCT89_23080 [Vibrio lentus]PMN15075.1 hypothetical protein BCT39_21270 [Vibrio lentus]